MSCWVMVMTGEAVWTCDCGISEPVTITSLSVVGFLSLSSGALALSCALGTATSPAAAAWSTARALACSASAARMAVVNSPQLLDRIGESLVDGTGIPATLALQGRPG